MRQINEFYFLVMHFFFYKVSKIFFPITCAETDVFIEEELIKEYFLTARRSNLLMNYQ